MGSLSSLSCEFNTVLHRATKLFIHEQVPMEFEYQKNE